MKPDIPLTDPRFKYVPSHLTNLRETFARVRAEGRESKPAPAVDYRRPICAGHGGGDISGTVELYWADLP
jgi:hypothetical protein